MSRAIRAVGAKLLFLPKYSADCQPHRTALRKLKHLLRKAGERTIDAVCNAIGQILEPSRRKSVKTTSPKPEYDRR